jgi:hypothetical protein
LSAGAWSANGSVDAGVTMSEGCSTPRAPDESFEGGGDEVELSRDDGSERALLN